MSAMAAKYQPNLPPMEVSRIGSKNNDANPLGSADAIKVGSVDLVTVAIAAAKRVGYYDKELADIFKLSAPDFSKAFNTADDTRNKPMKVALPKEYAEAFVRTMAEMLGLRIGGTAEQTRAFGNLMQACADVIKAGQM